MNRWCPICRKVKIYRREVKTCGSSECVQMWRGYSPEQKARAIENEADPVAFDVDPSGRITRPIVPEIPRTVERDNEFLKKVFGDDAPGVVKEEEIPMNYGHPIKCGCELCESVRKRIK